MSEQIVEINNNIIKVCAKWAANLKCDRTCTKFHPRGRLCIYGYNCNKKNNGCNFLHIKKINNYNNIDMRNNNTNSNINTNATTVLTINGKKYNIDNEWIEWCKNTRKTTPNPCINKNRNNPDAYNYSVPICSFVMKGTCELGNNCKFVHPAEYMNRENIPPPPSPYPSRHVTSQSSADNYKKNDKSKMCKNFIINKKCNYSYNGMCSFAHSDAELSYKRPILMDFIEKKFNIEKIFEKIFYVLQDNTVIINIAREYLNREMISIPELKPQNYKKLINLWEDSYSIVQKYDSSRNLDLPGEDPKLAWQIYKHSNICEDHQQYMNDVILKKPITKYCIHGNKCNNGLHITDNPLFRPISYEDLIGENDGYPKEDNIKLRHDLMARVSISNKEDHIEKVRKTYSRLNLVSKYGFSIIKPVQVKNITDNSINNKIAEKRIKKRKLIRKVKNAFFAIRFLQDKNFRMFIRTKSYKNVTYSQFISYQNIYERVYYSLGLNKCFEFLCVQQ